jgi:hypothetical protein
MNAQMLNSLPNFLAVVGLDEEPMGLFYTDEKPIDGFSPKPMDLPTREKEMRNEIDWQAVFGNFSCAIGHIWRARKKKMAAYFSAEQFGCPGAAFWFGFNKPQMETMINYISTGIPNWTEGERYCDSPDELRRIFEFVDPRPAPKKYCVIKPLSFFQNDEEPELVIFFSRPESLCGLHQLAVWPFYYLTRGKNKAVIGGWDPSARKFYKTDELSFTIPCQMFNEMLNRHGESFLITETWTTVQKKITRSQKAWGEVE